jgi:putative transposase
MPERLGAIAALLDIPEDISNLAVIWVDQGFSGPNFARVVSGICDARVEVIKRIESGFQVLPKRWIVERTYGWWNGYRRLSKDYELLPEMSEAMIYAAMTHLMLQRLSS